MNWIGLDTETTGVDIYHGARPYLVTVSDSEWNNTYWEWNVDPLTRKVNPPKQDVEEIAHKILEADYVVGQNIKFDIAALTLVLPPDFVWPYERIHDPLFAAHLVASNRSKDLTSLALDYLDLDISPYENAVEVAVNKCRNLVRRKASPIANWRIAKRGLPEMPSAKEKCWKYDMWLPRQVAEWAIENNRLDLIPESEEEHPWLTLTSAYANTDSSVCLAVFLQLKRILEERDLWNIYESRRELIPCIVDMERQGVPCSRKRIKELCDKFVPINKQAASTCINIANSYGHELELPKGGRNNSLSTFVFDVMKVPPVKLGNERKKKTAAPSLDKKVLDYWEATLPQRSKQLQFVQNLIRKRASDTALGFLDSYLKFGIVIKGCDDFISLHSALNPTGQVTLRWSSSNPNEQQISKREGYNVRYAFGPLPGREWWSLDAKNIELRIPAYESGERELIELFERPDEPPYYGSTHLLNFSTIYPDIWQAELLKVGIEKVGPHCKEKYESTWYQWCKNFAFAVQYGAQDRDSGEGTADIAAHKPGAHKLVKSRFSKLEQLNQKWLDFANTRGYVETLPDRSVDPDKGYPIQCTRNEWGRIKPTVPLAFHVQSTAMQWMGRAMVRCRKQLQVWNREAVVKPPYYADRNRYRMILQIHDELVFDFPKGKGKEPWRTNLPKVRQLARLMAQGGEDIGVPTPVGIEYHPVSFAESIKI
jgi:DNA polymerase I-like protein with 3'-5' exonuclease and polymerase domains